MDKHFHREASLLKKILHFQVPLMALVMSFVFCCKRKILSIVKPTLAWGPGDPKVNHYVSYRYISNHFQTLPI